MGARLTDRTVKTAKPGRHPDGTVRGLTLLVKPSTAKSWVLRFQINGKRRGEIRAPAGASDAEVRERVLADPDIAQRLEGLAVRKMIVVKDRIVNLVTG